MNTAIWSFDDLLRRAAELPAKRVLVVNPANAETFQAIADAQKKLPVSFLLVGSRQGIERGLASEGGDLSTAAIVASETVSDAVAASIELARDKKADVLMKGSVDTSTLMRAVLQESSGLRTGRLLSDVFIFEFPKRTDNKLIMITDGGRRFTNANGNPVVGTGVTLQYYAEARNGVGTISYTDTVTITAGRVQ